MLCVNFRSVIVYNFAVMEFWPLPLEPLKNQTLLNFVKNCGPILFPVKDTFPKDLGPMLHCYVVKTNKISGIEWFYGEVDIVFRTTRCPKKVSIKT